MPDWTVKSFIQQNVLRIAGVKAGAPVKPVAPVLPVEPVPPVLPEKPGQYSFWVRILTAIG